MSLRQVVPSGEELVAPDDEAGLRDFLAAKYAVPASPHVRVNMISSLDGSAAGSDGTSDSLTGGVDRILLGVIRSFADVVLVGAASVRREGYRMPRRARLAIVTMSGDLSGHRMTTNSPLRPLLVFCPATAKVRAEATTAGLQVEFVELDDERGYLPLRHLLHNLNERSLDRILCEGGPQLASQLLDAELLDDICLTTAPTLEGTGLPVFGTLQRPHPMALAHLLVDDGGFLFARWKPRAGTRQSAG